MRGERNRNGAPTVEAVGLRLFARANTLQKIDHFFQQAVVPLISHVFGFFAHPVERELRARSTGDFYRTFSAGHTQFIAPAWINPAAA